MSQEDHITKEPEDAFEDRISKSEIMMINLSSLIVFNCFYCSSAVLRYEHNHGHFSCFAV